MLLWNVAWANGVGDLEEVLPSSDPLCDRVTASGDCTQWVVICLLPVCTLQESCVSCCSWTAPTSILCMFHTNHTGWAWRGYRFHLFDPVTIWSVLTQWQTHVKPPHHLLLVGNIPNLCVCVCGCVAVVLSWEEGSWGGWWSVLQLYGVDCGQSKGGMKIQEDYPSMETWYGGKERQDGYSTAVSWHSLYAADVIFLSFFPTLF